MLAIAFSLLNIEYLEWGIWEVPPINWKPYEDKFFLSLVDRLVTSLGLTWLERELPAGN